METTQLKINDMNCGACVSHVTKALESVSGVQSVEVDLHSGTAIVRHAASTNPAVFIEAVTEAGYEAHRMWDANSTA